MKFQYNISSASISDIMNSIQQGADKTDKTSPSVLGAGLSLLIALRLCALMDVRIRVRRAWQEAESIAPDLVCAKDEGDFGQLRAKTWALCTRLSIVLGSIDGDIDSLRADAERLAAALSAMEQHATGQETVIKAITLLNTLIGAACDELPEQDSVAVTDEVRDLIKRIATSSKEIGGIADMLREHSRNECVEMEDSLFRLENGVERVKEASRNEKEARRKTGQKDVSTSGKIMSTTVAANDKVIPKEEKAAECSASRPAAPLQSAQPQPQPQPQPAQTTSLAEAAANLRSLVQKLRQNAANIRC